MAGATQGGADGAARQSGRFLLLYALAVAGGAVAYVPFLTILLPMRVTAMVGASDIEWLAYASFAGAICASIGNIGFGWLSDLTRTRRPWIAGGLALSCALLVGFSQVGRIEVAIGLLMAWQLALNMMLGPLFAWGGDTIPDAQKGTLGGLLAFAPAAGALVAAGVTWPGLAGPDARLWLVAMAVAAMVLPVLVLGPPRRFAQLEPATAPDPPADTRLRGILWRMWLARLLVQVSEVALFAYLYFWFRSIDPAMDDAAVARLFGIVLAVSVPLALAVGAWSDRHQRPFLPLPIAALVGAAGLVAMALAPGLPWAIAGYVLFTLSTAVFLSLHTGQTLRVLPHPRTRGRDMGLFNLTNTGPALIMPWLTLALVPGFGFGALFMVLAGCALAAALLLARAPQSM